MKKKVVALLLSAALLLTGCGTRPVKNEQEVTGGYVEQKIDWPQDFYCTGIHPNADSSVTLLGSKGWQGWCLNGFSQEAQKPLGYKGGIQIYDAKSDSSVTPRELPWEADLISRCSAAPHDISMALSESGELYVMASEIAYFGTTPEQPFQLYKLENDVLTSIPVDFSGLEPDWWDEIQFEGDFKSCKLEAVCQDSLFVRVENNWAVWDTSGKLLNSNVFRTGTAMYINSIGNGYVWTGQSNGYDLAYTLPDFKSVGKMELPEGWIFPDYEGDGFYHISHGFNYETNQKEEKILSHYTLNGDTREILMRSNDFSWGTFKIWLAAETPDHALWMILNDLGNQGLARYEYDPNKKTQNTLTVFSMNGSSTLTQTIALWNQRHPETRIEHITGSSDAGPSAMTTDDVMRNLNAQLLAGDGPDLLILDGLPADALIRQGLLTDLSGLLELDAMRPNVRSAFERDGKLYGIPAGMNPYISGGEAEDVDDRILTLQGLADAVEAMPAPTESADCCFSFATALYESLFDLFYPASAGAIWTDGQFDRSGFLNFIQPLNRIAHKNQVETIAAYNSRIQTDQDTEATSGEEFYKQFTASSLNEFWNGNCRWFTTKWNTAYTAGSFSRIVRDESGHLIGSEYPPISLYPMPGSQSSGVFVPICTAAIPQSSSKNRDLALEFIQLMLSDEVQGNAHGLDGIPVTQSGLNTAFEEVRKKEAFVLAEDPNALLNTMVPVSPDPVLQAAVREAAAKLYDGQCTQDEACKAIEDAAALRLAEQE